LPATVLRDARESTLLRTRLIDDTHMIRTSETVYSSSLPDTSAAAGLAGQHLDRT
jgi:hypothetical protein